MQGRGIQPLQGRFASALTKKPGPEAPANARPSPDTPRTKPLANPAPAQTIAVVHRGVLLEQGTHSELLALGGGYSRLVAAQGGGAANAAAS